MKIRTLLAAAAIAAACQPATVGAQTRDSGGTIMDLTEWRDIPSRELVINIVDLPNVQVVRARERIRDNRTVIQGAIFDDEDGGLRLQYILSPGGILGHHWGQDHRNGTVPKKWASRFWARFAEPFEYEAERKIYAFGERGGRAYMTRGRKASRRCIIARVVFLSDHSKGGWATEEVYDTEVAFWDCSGKRTLDQTAEWLESLKIVPSGYNRLRN